MGRIWTNSSRRVKKKSTPVNLVFHPGAVWFWLFSKTNCLLRLDLVFTDTHAHCSSSPPSPSPSPSPPSFVWLFYFLSPSFLPSLAHRSRQRLVVCFFNAFCIDICIFFKTECYECPPPPYSVLIKHQKRRA